MIRLAVPADAGDLARLRWSSRDTAERQREPLDDFVPRFGAWFVDALTSGAWHVAVAPAPGAGVLGCMYLQSVAAVPLPGVALRRWGYLTHAFVDAAHRNRGLGGAMLALLIDKARQLRLEELHVWPSVPAVALYTRAGFRSPEQQRAQPDPDEPSYVLPLE